MEVILMAIKTTRKEIARKYYCYGSGYGDLQYLLKFQDRTFYTCGVYGWNFDVYTFRKYAITTGYRGMIHHYDRQYELEREYDQKAHDIIYSHSEDAARLVNTLLEEFLRKVFDDDTITIYKG